MSALLMLSTAAFAQPPASEPTSHPDAAAVQSDRWLLVVCGLPGDEEHRERLTEACNKILAAAGPVMGIAADRVRVLAGDESMRDALERGDGGGICTGETIPLALDQLAAEVQADDACWVFLLGHSQLYDARSCFNIAGPDVDQDQFASWAEGLRCSEQVFVLTMPLSGFWIKPLAGDRRLIISATEADLEFTGTEMPYALADVLAGDAQHQILEDLDHDGAVSLLDLYLATCLEIRGRFRAIERLQTEHAQLEDNGDGRGSEVQQKYLPDPEVDGEPGASPPSPEPVRSQSLDGYRAAQISLTAPG